MKAGPVEIGVLLQKPQRYCVPIYQRHYVWNREKQWEPFWNDIRTKAVERMSGRERRFSHYMGAVVLEARGGFSARSVRSFQVVDGQQRLTTFQIFLAAARDYAKSIGLDTTAETISAYLINPSPHLMENPETEIFKVWPTQYDRELFLDIVNIGSRTALRKKYSQYFYRKRDQIYAYSTTPNLLAGYGFFYDRIKHSVETDDLYDEFAEAPEIEEEEDEEAETERVQENSQPTPQGPDEIPREIKLNTIWQSLVEEFKVVEIVLEEGDDAQVIFETLNERGEPLLAADLVRNNIFQRADARKENAEKLFAKHWKNFEDPFWSVMEKQGRYKKPRIEFFLSNFIAGQIAGEVNLSKLFSEYKAFLKSKKFDTVDAELQEIASYGEIYRDLIGRSGDTPLSRFSKRLLPWDVTTVFPLVMRLWQADTMEEDDKAQCLEMILSLIVRRAVCELTTKNYNKFFLSIIAYMDDKGWSKANLATFLLAQKSETGRFPRDEEFEQRWLSTPVYTKLQPARTRAILEEIEIAKRGRFHETKALAENLSVEHVLPQDWEKTWPLRNGTVPTGEEIMQTLFSSTEDDSTLGQIVRRNRMKETIGNLTVITKNLNSSFGNGPFSEKKAALGEHSLLVLNREITAYDNWDEEKIYERGKNLLTTAKKIWTVPALEMEDKKGLEAAGG